MTRSTLSIRLDESVHRQLKNAADAANETVTTLVERYIREGMAVASHPGIVFKSGPSGRRAALAGGPDVWELVSALRRTAGDESSRIAELAQEFGLHERQVVLALDYAAANRNEVQARIVANDQALIEAERIAGERQRLLA